MVVGPLTFLHPLVLILRLEKGVMAFGWGRWEEVQSHAQLRKGWSHTDIEVTCSAFHASFVLLYKTIL